MFCFPYAGAGASIFRLWPDDLPPEVEVCAVQLPGRESRIRETPVTRIPELIPVLEAALIPWLDRPFAMFGHSMGGLIAFTLAQDLRRHHALLPQHFWVSARPAPHLADHRPPMHHLATPEFVSELRKRFDGIPDQVFEDAELMRLFLPMLRADIAMIETYRYDPQVPLDCPISAFGGSEDSVVAMHEIQAWRFHTARDFRLRMLPGDHFFVRDNRKALMDAIVDDLPFYGLTRGGAPRY